MTKLFHIYDRKDLSAYDHCPVLTRPVYGVYHVYCDTGWEGVVADQVATLRGSGLLAATQRLYVSMITFRADDEERLRRILPEPQVEIVAVSNDPKAYEYPALRQVRELGMKGEAYIYYFHTKGISYQTFESRDRRFLRFRAKIVAWREMLEYFIFTRWHVAVNALADGYDCYGCYQWPPRSYTMFSGNFFWIRSEYAATLPALTPETIGGNRFYSEIWLYQKPHTTFSAFETVADLYYVRIPRSLYTLPHPPTDVLVVVQLAQTA